MTMSTSKQIKRLWAARFHEFGHLRQFARALVAGHGTVSSGDRELAAKWLANKRGAK